MTTLARVVLDVLDRALMVVDVVTAPITDRVWPVFARRIIPAE